MKNFDLGELLLKSVQGHGRDIIAQPYTKIDTALYQARYEVLSKRNKKIIALSIIGLFLFAGTGWITQSLTGEAFAAYEEMTTEEFYYEGTQEECQAIGSAEGCEIRNFNGGIWFSLLAALLFSIAFAPIASALTMLTYRNKDVSDAWIGKTYGILAGIPMAIIWALLWLICLPFTWGLLPWGEWSINWWKIFPFGFGLIWMGGLPLIITVINFFKKLANPEYNHDLVHGAMPLANEDSEGDEDSSSPSAEQTASEIANSVGARSSYIEAGIPPKRSLGGRAIFVAILAAIMMIPGIIMLIIGGVMAEEFIEGEGSSSYTLEIIDEDDLGDQGFIIFIQATPGDFNGNGMHDYCENIIVNANHSGAWMSDPWTGWSSYNEPDETREVFEVEISHEGSGCDAVNWPKEKWVNDAQLVKIGRACYGCMAGNTTIIAEHANEPTNPVGMWIQDGEKINESTVLTIIGAIITGIGAVTLITIIMVKISKSKAAARESIEIIESKPGQPVRFRINDPPKGRDAWVGIYPASTGDSDHGDRWSWLRDIDVNNATLPGQPAGNWSIRVFKDGGYKLQHRVDFEISTSHQQTATPTSSKGIVGGNATITTAKSTYTIDEGIDFSFTAPKLPNDAWIGIVPVAIPHGDEAVNDSHDISYAHLGGSTKGEITLPNPGLGTWTLRLHDTDNNGRELTHVVFEVVSSLGRSERLHKGRACEIKIIEAKTGKPIRFNVNNRPSGNDAWFGLYPEQATDQEHGEQHQNWMYFRDVGQNELSLPAKSAGRWSIRVFSDGGFNMIKRLDFDIIKVDEKSAQSAKKIQSALKRSSGKEKTSFWDSVD